MKSHAIIPIFIPQMGCPNDCIFCNQKLITARQEAVSPDTVSEILDLHLATLCNRGIKTIEVAFYGGSFTGLPLGLQSAYLEQALQYKKAGRIQKIHLSTRPDLIDRDILEHLKRYGTDIIELGVQSFDEKVLLLSRRGHGRDAIFRSANLIHQMGFRLGIQLMIGLPGDSREASIQSARETAALRPDIARIYPTIVIEGTDLHQEYLSGSYRPLPLSEAVSTTKEMYRILTSSGIHVIRVGLKSSDNICDTGSIAGDTYHPAFRQLVQGEIAKEQIQLQLYDLFGRMQTSQNNITLGLYSNQQGASNLAGHQSCNRLYFQQQFPDIRIKFLIDPLLEDDHYVVRQLPC